MMMIPIDELLRFVKEDAPFGDITSLGIIPDITCKARILVKDTGLIAGLEEGTALFSHYNVTVKQLVADGAVVSHGTVLYELTGKARDILLLERTVLNIIGRMSGIATRTGLMIAGLRQINTHVRIAATRKTAPGLRLLDKKAVILGGGEPHRNSLSDHFLIKDNHLALVPLEEAIKRARIFSVYKKIEVEVENPGDALKAAEAGADIIMLDNMEPEKVAVTIDMLEKKGLRNKVLVELSGGIDPNTIGRFAAQNVDIISMGALTHTVSNFDVSLEILSGYKTVEI